MKTGGPAFPFQPFENKGGCHYVPQAGKEYPGMTLRDWFAGQALVGIITQGLIAESHWAFRAYQTADAMIAYREKVKP